MIKTDIEKIDIDLLKRHIVTETERGEMYINLYHGRDDPNQDMDETGYAGPMFGPIVNVGSTYNSHMIIEVATGYAMLNVIEDCIEFDGKFYGQWTVFIAK